ncbi:MAG: HAD family hydrolase [Acidimicrobiales bacterium]
MPSQLTRPTVASTVRLLLLAAALIVGLSACRATAEVTSTVEPDGSGRVEVVVQLDPEASEALIDLDIDGDGLPLADLAQAGWEVEPPMTASDGSTTIAVGKAFGTPDQYDEVMAELNGPDGPFRDFTFVRRRGFAEVDYAVTGEIDVSDGFESFGDTGLEETLGLSLAEIATRYGAQPQDVQLTAVVVLPGRSQGEPSAGVISDEDGGQVSGRWSTSLADGGITDVTLETGTRQVAALALRGMAVLTAVLALVLLLAQLLRILRPDRRRPPPRRTSTVNARTSPRPDPAVAPDTPADEVDEQAGQPRVMALDGHGVLYREADDVGNVLIPFVRERGSSLPDEEIAARARQLRLGRLTSAEFWALVAVTGEADELDAAYVSRHQLSPGVIKYLRAQRDAGVRVACITNDCQAWATRLRAGHSLERLIDPWVISGSVGVLKPDRPIFEVLRRVTRETASQIMILDDDLTVLDAARELGFATLWFAPGGTQADARGHRMLRSFEAAAEVADARSPRRSAR